MARGTGGTASPVSPGIVARVGAALRGAIRGAQDAWFGPGEPQEPQAPESKGRAFDYPVAINIVAGKPRTEQGESAIDFATLRALAEPALGGLDLVRLAIERRKDQMESQEWAIRGRDGKDGGPRAREIEQLLRRPDLEHSFAQWMRMLLEDMLVIDAATVYLAPSTRGYLIPQVMDGATLKRLVGVDGRTPLPPDPAFQQVLKGMPASTYTLDELVHSPRNPRSNRVYGMSPVEQVIMTIAIALKRQTSQLEFYTVGSVPDSLCSVPDSWTPEQIRTYQTYFDAALSGNTGELKKIRFVPSGFKLFETKAGILKDEFDEWLARIVCFCFSLSPQALMKQMNRATAETSKESAQEEGLEPVKKWFKGVVDDVLEKGFKEPGLELAYADEEIADPETKAKVMSLALGGKAWLTQDEVRGSYGKDPLTPEQRDELTPPAPVLPPPGQTPDEAAQAQEEAKAQLVEVQKRAAAPVLEVADGIKAVAASLRISRGTRKVKFFRNGDGVVEGAEVIE
jgi:hypothetical protein